MGRISFLLRKRRRWVASVVALAVVCTSMLVLHRSLTVTRRAGETQLTAATPQIGGKSASAAKASVAPPPQGAAVNAEVVPDAALLSTPEAQAHFARERFNARARAFFAEAAALTPVLRERAARELEAAIDGYERSRELSAGEALQLRLGLIETSGAAEAERAERMAAVLARYENEGRRREARWLAEQGNDATFRRYKAREAVVVAEVMAMTEVPDGLTRDEYLRRRLEAERVAAMP
ncbi:MAG: hypothetical protein JNN30_02905 [Rhodanobacteraceae bacterium]|nr:hypothetical protein [Rhodanobacteraceae bacterium]